MEQYPDYIFSQSQPLMYQEMKDNYPAMYREVKKRIAEGRWEVIGSFWVEPEHLDWLDLWNPYRSRGADWSVER